MHLCDGDNPNKDANARRRQREPGQPAGIRQILGIRSNRNSQAMESVAQYQQLFREPCREVNTGCSRRSASAADSNNQPEACSRFLLLLRQRLRPSGVAEDRASKPELAKLFLE